MENQLTIHKLAIPVIIFLVGFGLVTGCNDRERDNEMEQEGVTTEQPTTSGQAMNQGQTFTATLQGSNEVPAVETDANGSVRITINGDSVRVSGKFSGLSSEYTASHIHMGAKGENGNPIQPLDPKLGSDKTSGAWSASYSFDQSQLDALKADSLYINVHSVNHKSGEIRGQLSASAASQSDTTGSMN